jgi:hypothetical protein
LVRFTQPPFGTLMLEIGRESQHFAERDCHLPFNNKAACILRSGLDGAKAKCAIIAAAGASWINASACVSVLEISNAKAGRPDVRFARGE